VVAPIIRGQIQENVTLGVTKASIVEPRRVAQQWPHNIGTGYMLQKFPFGRNSIVWKDHFESIYFEVDKVNKVLGLPALRTVSGQWGSLPTEKLPTSVHVQVDLLLSIVVVATVLE